MSERIEIPDSALSEIRERQREVERAEERLRSFVNGLGMGLGVQPGWRIKNAAFVPPSEQSNGKEAD